ncbi:6-phosphogluconolactonase [Candidatus Peribacteria bacterium RIFCSPHIGHO2_02_FULL_49_16]|nr:MAG: 6-phosphogluconolactonase [Candidatus Peribacteria bacterium RIFCSPHIGHO2_01_FULL_49_38]OGJ58684.1 MAG: 6-phosphogluconolactonase [Candidatus Peribacteria bacterium RIFCSPHIGHO2_02_FULL_49_16]
MSSIFDQINCKDHAEFVEKSADIIASSIQKSITGRGECLLCLSGGKTPCPVYTEIGKRKDIDWQKVSIFLCDERYVPRDHTMSNQKLIHKTLLRHDQLLVGSSQFPNTSLPLEHCIADYAARIKTLWHNHSTDIAILGMGIDGHTASLFPPLSDAELGDEKLVLHTTTHQFAVHDRITLSLNALAASRHCIVLLTGEKKRHIWEEMMYSNEDERRWPMKRILEICDVTVVTDWEGEFYTQLISKK